MRNTGLRQLVLVDPGDWRTEECWRTAWGAHELLEGAQVAATLTEAIAGATHVAALSGRHDGPSPPIDVREAAAEIAALGEDEPVALVFGPEATGLTLHEIALCSRRVLIPSHPDQPSLNLSHAVMVAAYEVFRARPRPSGLPAPRRAAQDEKHRFLHLLREGLLAVGALPENNTDGYFLEWEALFNRADITPKELRLLEHMARKMIRPRS
jgi:TrmH family RNA methyltransferase